MADNDDDLKFSDAPGDESEIPDDIPKEQRILRTQAYDKSISDVIGMIEAGDIILDPEYQRNYVWDNRRASLLIESILLNVPIPVIYVSEEDDSKWSVVDGLQRLNSLRRFFNDDFKLRGLEVLTELNNSQYSTMNPKASRILRNGILRMILIFKESHPEIKYDIFMRLNRGAIKLNEQELRNCLFRGKLNDLINHLRTTGKFLAMIGLKGPHKRMNDSELILRYFMIADSYDPETGQVRHYTGKIKTALNRYVQAHRNPSPEKLTAYSNRFRETVDKAFGVFGEEAFQRIYENGSYEGRPNRAIMDFIMQSFEHFSAKQLQENATAIKALLQKLPLEDSDFNDSITFGTSDKKRLEYRLRRWNVGLREILGAGYASGF